MTNNTLKTDIQTDSHDLTIIRTRGHQFAVFCEHCQKDVSIFTSEQVSKWLRLIRNGQVHLIEKDHGSLVCGNSL